jgi:hypothetical protein
MNIGDALGKIWMNNIGDYAYGQDLIDAINPYLGPTQQLTLKDNGVVLLGRFDGLPKHVQHKLLLQTLMDTRPKTSTDSDNTLDLPEAGYTDDTPFIPVPVPVPTPVPVPVPVPIPVPVPQLPSPPVGPPIPTPAPDFPVGYVKSWRPAITMLIGLAFVVSAGMSAMNVEIMSRHIYGQPPEKANVFVRWIADILETLSNDMNKNEEQQTHPGNAEGADESKQGDGSGSASGSH